MARSLAQRNRQGASSSRRTSEQPARFSSQARRGNRASHPALAGTFDRRGRSEGKRFAMDRTERKRAKRASRYANEAEVSPRDRPLLDSPAGRDNDAGSSDQDAATQDEVRRVDVGAVPRSGITGQHDSGSGADETIDGFDDTEEAVRIAAEDTPTGGGLEDRPAELPVFERRLTKPKV